MPKIYIDRSSERFNGANPYKIYIDGEQVGTVGNGQDKYFDVTPGEHTIVAKMNSLMGSPKVSVTVKGDEVKILKTNGTSGTIWLLVLGTACIGIVFLQDYLPLVKQYLYLILPGLFVLYFLTLGRSKYLNLILDEKAIKENSVKQSIEGHGEKAKIYINRKNEFFNRNQPCQIYIDGEKVGTVDSGEENYFEVDEGEHTIVAKMGIASSTWMGGSPKVKVLLKGGEIQKLKVSGLGGLLWLIGFMVFVVVAISAIKPYVDFDFKNYFIVTYAGLFILFYFTILKRRYLSLTLHAK